MLLDEFEMVVDYIQLPADDHVSYHVIQSPDENPFPWGQLKMGSHGYIVRWGKLSNSHQFTYAMYSYIAD